MDAELTPGLLLRAYASGIFPMAESADDDMVHWVDPSRRGIIPIDGLHISRSLRKAILRGDYEASFNSAFTDVVLACADRESTWINGTIFDLYRRLHEHGHAHSQEIWRRGKLAGGVYGVSIGAAFFGESMFSKERDGSKIALAYLMDRLNLTGFTLFDTQFITDHLRTLGAIEISRDNYLARLADAISRRARITALETAQSAEGIIQRNGQTSYRG